MFGRVHIETADEGAVVRIRQVEMGLRYKHRGTEPVQVYIISFIRHWDHIPGRISSSYVLQCRVYQVAMGLHRGTEPVQVCTVLYTSLGPYSL